MVCALLLTLLPGRAAAYTIQSGGTPGCHEGITVAAWRRVQEALPDRTRPLRSRGEDEALIADVPFDAPRSLLDIGGVTLLLGVRDNDVKDHGPNDLETLAIAASDPKLQADHCLRTAEEDEPDGSRRAVEHCRSFIRNALLAALDGLDDQGRPDTNKRDELRVSLAIRGQIDVSVPRFFLQAGRALHAIQDSFTHTFRNPDDPGKIRVVLNFVEYTQDTLDEAVDGPAHASELDECEDLDELRLERRELATEASSLVLIAALDPELDAAGKERAMEQVLDDYVAYDEQADCTLENGWCDAAEKRYGSPPLACSFGRGNGAGHAALVLLAAAIFAVLRRRHAGRAVAGVGVALGLLGSARPAAAETTEATADSGPIAGPAKALAGESDAATPGKPDKAGAFFARVAVGASYDNSALAGGLGLRYSLSRKWTLGFDGEWNPYVALSPRKLRAGSANAYVSLIRRFQQRYENVNIRSQLALGGSMLLFDLVGADRYSMGPYFGLSFLGIEWKMARGFYLTVDPTYIAIPVPNIVGVPFMYVQYRFLVGLELGG